MKRKGKKAKLNNSQRRRDGRVGRTAGQSLGLKRDLPCAMPPSVSLTPRPLGSIFYAIRVLRAFRSTWLLL